MSEKNVPNKELLLKLIEKVDSIQLHVETEFSKRPTRFELFGYFGLVASLFALMMI